MHTNMMKNIVLSSPDKEGVAVQIRVINGPLSGKELLAKKVQESANGVIVNCYHVTDNNIKTYLLEKDIELIGN